MLEIKVGFLVAYDYEYLYHSIPLVYETADKIVLAIDRDRLSWSGIQYKIDQPFFDWIKKIDWANKVQIYEDNFYLPTLSTVECDTRERNMLAKQMGEGGWHVQIDSDEYFLDFPAFVNELRKYEKLASKKAIYVYTRFITLFKKVKNGFLYINDHFECVPIATNKPNYSLIRIVPGTIPIYTDCLVVHQSWARTENDIRLKLKSWGHSNDFNIESYFNLWKAIDENNYRYMHDFHPLGPNFWKSLEYVKKSDIIEMVGYLKSKYSSFKVLKTSLTGKLFKNMLPPIIFKVVKRIFA